MSRLRSISNDGMHVMRGQGGGRQGHVGGKMFCVSVRTKLFWRKINCAKPRPDTEYQDISLSHSGLGRRDLRIMWEYDLATNIATEPLTYPRMCEMGSSSFPTMS